MGEFILFTLHSVLNITRYKTSRQCLDIRRFQFDLRTGVDEELCLFHDIEPHGDSLVRVCPTRKVTAFKSGNNEQLLVQRTIVVGLGTTAKRR